MLMERNCGVSLDHQVVTGELSLFSFLVTSLCSEEY